MTGNSRLVYSTEKGRICLSCGKPAARCACKSHKPSPGGTHPDDGIIRIGRDTKGRKGKGVTTVYGLAGDAGELKAMAARLKRCCGSGGSVKEGVILVQGDHRSALQAELIRQGYRVKLVGG